MRIVRRHVRSRFALSSELCVQNSCVQPAAMSGTPSVIRSGPQRHGYVYTYVGDGTYKCERGSDWKDNNEVLWLMKEHDAWYAFDAPENAIPTSVPTNKVIFISTGADAHIAGWHTWIMKKSNNDAQGRFQTTLIES